MAVSFGPDLELFMFGLDLLQGLQKEVLYFVLQVHELRSFGAGILLTEGFDFVPLDFGTVLMEEPTFGLGVLSFFANEPWFSTLGVHTHVFG